MTTEKHLHLLPLGRNKMRIPGRRQTWRPLCKAEVRKLDKTTKQITAKTQEANP